MSDETEPKEEKELTDEEASPLKALLKRSLAPDEPALSSKLVPPTEAAKSDRDRDAELLRAVQKKLRQRSKGKFYADGWSTSQSKINYALVAVIMLVTIIAVYLALGPMGITR
jgi:hypothetical protein